MTPIHEYKKKRNKNEALLIRVKNLLAACRLNQGHLPDGDCVYCDHQDCCTVLMQKLGLTNCVCMSLVYAAKLLNTGYKVVELGLRTSEKFAELTEVLYWDSNKETYEQHIDRICISAKAATPKVGLELVFAKIIDLHCIIAYKTSIGEFGELEEYSFAYAKLIELMVLHFEISYSTNMDTVLERAAERLNDIDESLVL